MKKAKVFDAVTIILLLILAVLIYCVIQLKVLHKPYINLFGHTVFQVITGSMEDTIKINDFVLVKLDAKYDENDIITYQTDDALVTHRLIEIRNEYLVTKGDNNNTIDEPVMKEQVLGRVVKILPRIGIYIKVVKEPIVLAPLCILIILVVLLLKDKEVKKNEKKE
jgi:signal peptidase